MAFNLFFNGSAVTEIELNTNDYSSYHFQGCTNLTKVAFKGDDDITIPDNAFKGCTDLKEITFGNESDNAATDEKYNLTIGAAAFSGCSIEVFETETFGNIVFNKKDDDNNWNFNTNLKSFLIPKAKSFIGDIKLTTLKKLKLNSTLIPLENYSYQLIMGSCNSEKDANKEYLEGNIEVEAKFFQEIEFESPETVNKIIITNEQGKEGSPLLIDGQSKDWSSLTYLEFGPGLKFSGGEDQGFNGLELLENLIFHSNEEYYPTISPGAFSGIGQDLTELNIPDNVEWNELANYSYSCFSFLSRNDIANSILVIRTPFILCEKAATQIIPYTLSKYFDNLPKNTSINITKVIGEMGTEWDENGMITKIETYNNKITDNFFKSETNLASITLPEGIEIIEASAFSGCTSLDTINNFEWVKTIGASAFTNCYSVLNNLNLSQVQSIGTSAFEGCVDLSDLSGKNIKLNLSSATKIDDSAFKGCSNIQKIILPRYEVTIGKLAFENCVAVEELILSTNPTLNKSGSFNFGSGESLNNSIDIYYRGSKEEYDAILTNMEDNNSPDFQYFNPSTSVNVYYYSENQPTSDENNYWYEIGGGVKVYFSLSAFNNPNDIKNILYTVVDPNHGLVNETNSMMTAAFAPAGYLSTAFNQDTLNENGEYYFEIDLGNRELFKPFSTGQYYQIQIYLTDIESIPNIITTEWINTNKDRISLGSQISLIRPVEMPIISIENDGDAGYELEKVKGNLVNYVVIKEPLANCYCEFYDTSDQLVYTSTTIKNTILDRFEIPINFDTPGTYKIKTYFTTINGYSNFVESIFTLIDYTKTEWDGSNSISLLPDIGGVKISFPNECSNYQKVQRKEGGGRWQTIWTSSDVESNIGIWSSNDFYDYSVEAGCKYQYRAIRKNNYADWVELTKPVEIDDIVLCDKNELIILKYNPVITNFKHTTQDSVLGTLGGKYPIIRRNGDMDYRQFNLSGTIFIDKLYNENELYVKPVGSRPANYNYDNWTGWRQELGSLITFKEDVLLKELNNSYEIANQKEFEKRARLKVMSFLTNGQPKLFKSYEEGNIIVYLSNVSFTPNKTLGRHIYDFSATVTECCEMTQENLKKYI